jgi:hypothetical protein
MYPEHNGPRKKLPTPMTIPPVNGGKHARKKAANDD